MGKVKPRQRPLVKSGQARMKVVHDDNKRYINAKWVISRGSKSYRCESLQNIVPRYLVCVVVPTRHLDTGTGLP